jgi:hypothetical protein
MRTRFLLRVVILCVLCVSAVSSPARGDVGADTLLNRLTDFSSMPRFRDYTAHQFSSYERNGGNGDAQHFLRMEGTDGVMAEMDGPGAIVRLWSANADSAGKLKIYLDDIKAPVIDEPFKKLFDGSMPPFESPIARLSSGGFISYLPIPYAKHCKVVVENPKGLYYHVTYVSFPAGTEVRSFQFPLPEPDRDALARVQEAWNNAGRLPHDLEYGGEYRVPAGQTVEIATRRGPARIRAFRMKVEGAPPEGMRKLVLRGYFDGHSTPDIEAPVSDFFGNSFGKEARSLLAGCTPEGMYCLLPMPFGRSARFTLENGRSETVTVRTAIEMIRRPFDPAREGYLHALYMEEMTRTGEPHHWLKINGARGHFVGEVQSMSGAGLGFLEGDEQFRVDGEQWLKSDIKTTVIGPWNGTGTEDYFNSGWYFNKGPIVLPTHGAVVREDEGRVSAYRWHILDTPSFTRSIDAQIEHGGVNDRPNTYYASVVFWYSDGAATPRGTMPAATALAVPRHVLSPPHNEEIAKVTGAGLTARAWQELNENYMGAKVLEGTADAGIVKIPISVNASDRYRLTLHAAKSANYGSVQVSIDGVSVGAALSLHGDGEAAMPVSLPTGEVALTKGAHTLEITAAKGSGRFGIAGYALASMSRMISTWKISDTYPNSGDTGGFDVVYEPEKHLDDPVATGNWRDAKAGGDGTVDLIPLNAEHEHVAIYAVAQITAPKEMDTDLLVGSDDGVKIWLNGNLVHRHPDPRALVVDEDTVPVHLKAGKNLVMLKVVQGIGGWGYAARARDPDGTLKFSSP